MRNMLHKKALRGKSLGLRRRLVASTCARGGDKKFPDLQKVRKLIRGRGWMKGEQNSLSLGGGDVLGSV